MAILAGVNGALVTADYFNRFVLLRGDAARVVRADRARRPRAAAPAHVSLGGHAPPAQQTALLVAAGATIAIGVVGALGRDTIRGVLSFHIVSQIGYLIFGLALLTPRAVAAGLFCSRCARAARGDEGAARSPVHRGHRAGWSAPPRARRAASRGRAAARAGDAAGHAAAMTS